MYIYINNKNESIESVNKLNNYSDIFQFNNFLNGEYVELTDEQYIEYKNLPDNIIDYKLFFDEFNDISIKYYVSKNNPYIIDSKYPLHPDLFPNGTTLEDFESGKLYLLSEEQYQFYQEHPHLPWINIIKMELPPEPEPYVETVEDVRNNKLMELSIYDNSENVNSFSLNGINAWFTVSERNNYAQSIQSAKILNKETLMFFINNMAITVPTVMAEQMLAAVQLYADEAFIVTKQHEINISKLETKEEIEAYDFTKGYPDKLVFEL